MAHPLGATAARPCGVGQASDGGSRGMVGEGLPCGTKSRVVPEPTQRIVQIIDLAHNGAQIVSTRPTRLFSPLTGEISLFNHAAGIRSPQPQILSVCARRCGQGRSLRRAGSSRWGRRLSCEIPPRNQYAIRNYTITSRAFPEGPAIPRVSPFTKNRK